MSSSVASGGSKTSTGSPVRNRIANTTKRDAEEDEKRLQEAAEEVDLHVPPQTRDGFDVRRLGEHVDRLHPLEDVAVAHEVADVARERGRIARDVDEARGRRASRACRAPSDGSPRAADRRPRRPACTPCRRSSGSTWRTSPARNVQFSMPLAPRVADGVRHRGRRELDAVDLTARAREQQADRAGAGIEIDHRLRPGRARTRPATSAKSRSACRVFVWKNEFAEIWKSTSPRRSVIVSRPSSRCSSVPTATLAFLAFTFSTTLAVAGTRARRCSATGASAVDVGRRGDDVDHRLSRAPPFAKGDEPQEAAALAVGRRLVHAESTRADDLRGSRRAACSSRRTATGSDRCRGRRRTGRPRAARARVRPPRGRP